jgi:transcriptional regulator of heat shock response
MGAQSAGRALLTPRQQEILRRVVEEYVATGQPVGSKTLV